MSVSTGRDTTGSRHITPGDRAADPATDGALLRQLPRPHQPGHRQGGDQCGSAAVGHHVRTRLRNLLHRLRPGEVPQSWPWSASGPAAACSHRGLVGNRRGGNRIRPQMRTLCWRCGSCSEWPRPASSGRGVLPEPVVSGGLPARIVAVFMLAIPIASAVGTPLAAWLVRPATAYSVWPVGDS